MKISKLNKTIFMSASLMLLSTSNVFAANKAGFYGGDFGGSPGGFIQLPIDPKHIYVVNIEEVMLYRPVGQGITSSVNVSKRAVTLKDGTKQYRHHKGTDFGSPVGTPIKSISDGVVSFNVRQGDGKGFGYYTGVDHGNGYKSLYAHLSKFNQKPGAKIKAGDVIGYTGNTGGTSGPHLHFELSYNSFIVDPFAKNAPNISYGDDLPRMEYSNPVDSMGNSPITSFPMPVLVPITAFDCNTIEVSNYMSQLNYKNPKGMTNIPTVIEAEPALLKTKEIEYGEEANECLTIFNDGSFGDMVDQGKEIFEDLSGLFSDPIGAATKFGNMAKDRAEAMYNRMSTKYKKGICKRLNNGDLKKTVINEIDHAVQTGRSPFSTRTPNYTSGVNVKAAGSINKISELTKKGDLTREDMVANHFTYLVIENQLGKGSKDLDHMLNRVKKGEGGNLIDDKIDEYGNIVGDKGTSIVDDKLNDLENIIFGK